MRPWHRLAMAQRAVQTKRTTIQHVCTTFAISETCDHYVTTRPDENVDVADWLVRRTTTHRTWGGDAVATDSTSNSSAGSTNASTVSIAPLNGIDRKSVV